ncbi:MAG TPA: tetratricopeptide repeat protein [bacterium]|nr:tetratricopeptide repeat protein [bacterium]
MPDRPGVVTFVLTDIEGSTNLLQHHGDARYAELLDEHRRILRAAFTGQGGREVDTDGDAILVAFSSARAAVVAAVTAQRALLGHPWPTDARLRVRMGVHTGEPVRVAGKYVGLDVHRAVRICNAAHGGQILLSRATLHLVEDALPPEVAVRDLGTHRLKDLREPEHLFQVTHPELEAEFPPLRSFPVERHNLPQELSSFVGRDLERAEVGQLLSTARLVTLTGTGGCGKTRLALRVAAEVVPRYADGVWLVELAPLTDPALVLQTVASTLGVREIPGRPWLSSLTDALRDRTMLLVIDNCEHLIDACAHVIDAILGACPGVGVLATSRESLRIAGERMWRVPSLSLLGSGATATAAAGSEAVRLFLDRAAAVQPSFAITSQNAGAVLEVCRRLDGIPLAIELAAARVAALPVSEIARRLGDQLSLLNQGSRTALPRHRTLQAVMDWGYHLLSGGEQALLRRLAVFAGGWTLEAAEAVCGGRDEAPLAVLDLLTQLVLKSLVLMDEQDANVRYRFLETVRQYSVARLRESGEEAAVRERHLDWFLGLAERAAPELVGSTQAAWFDRLEAEHDNLRAALEWALQSGRTEAGLRLIGAAWRFWFVRGYFAEGRGWLESLLRVGESTPAVVRADALNAAGNLAVFGQGDYAAGRRFYEHGLALWKQTGDGRGVARILGNLAFVAAGEGDPVAERALLDESLALRRELGDQWGVALALHNLGRAAFRHGDYGEAAALLAEALDIWQGHGDKQHIAMALTNLGLVASRQGDYARARALLAEGLVLRRELGDKPGLAYQLEGFAGLAAAQGEAVRAARLFGAAEALREAIAAPLLPSDRPDYDRDVAAARATIPPREFADAWALGRATALDDAIAEAERD